MDPKTGFSEQVPWSTCSEGESKENRPGHFNYKIWHFTMKSSCCKHKIIVQTDPKSCEYVIISGAQRKTEKYDIEDAETFEPLMKSTCWIAKKHFASYAFCIPERNKLADPFYRLKHQEEDLQMKKEAGPVLLRLERVSDARHSDDYALNKVLQAQLRFS